MLFTLGLPISILVEGMKLLEGAPIDPEDCTLWILLDCEWDKVGIEEVSFDLPVVIPNNDVLGFPKEIIGNVYIPL